MRVLASADLLHHMVAADRTLDVVGESHFDRVRLIGVQPEISASLFVLVGDMFGSKIKIVVIADIFLGFEVVFRLEGCP